MIEVNISKKLKTKEFVSLITYLHNLSNEVCFTSFHQYHLDEEVANDALNEYKMRCKDRHRQLQKWYDTKEPFLMKTLKKLKVQSEEEFQEYKEQIYLADMELCKKMQEVLDKLEEEQSTRDYKEVFPQIKDSYKEVEVHMYDTVAVSIMPLDLVVYKTSEETLKTFLNMKSITSPVLMDSQARVFYINPMFCNNEEAFAIIQSELGTVSLIISEEEYKNFKKLKIRHKKETALNEKE